MREIKFRAWDDGKKEWLLGYEMPNLGGFSLFGEMMLFEEWARVLNEYLLGIPNKFKDLKVMQYTGLKDKNGKEIYEGDIVRSEVWAGEAYSVSFNRGGFCFGNGDKNYLHDAKYLESFEVIGNIYENPELLDNQEGK